MKTKNQLVVFACILSFAMLLFAQMIANANMSGEQLNHDEKIIKVNLISPLVKNVSVESDSVFIDLLPEAIKIGLAEAQLKGELQQEVLADGTTRMSIYWHSLGLPVSNDSMLVETLDTPLTSQFRTDGERVEPGTIVTAVGDLDGLIDKFLILKERAKEDRTPKHVVEKEDDEEDDEKSDSSGGLSPSGSSFAAGGDYDTPDSNTGEYNANLITSTWVDCTNPRVELAAGVIHKQHKKIEVDENGNTVSTGECEDTGTTYPIIKEYGDPCNIIYDYEDLKAYEQYREYAEFEGSTIDITGCSNDFLKSYDIYERNDGCGIRHDFVGGRSIAQTKLYYTDNEGNETQITDCIDTDKAYTHFLTQLSCSPYVDDIENKVFEYERTAYRLDDGTIEYASECRVIDGPGFDLLEAYCDPKFEHDFTSGQSFYRTRDYYLNDEGETKYLTDCSRSTATNFPHIYKTDTCEIENDDETLSYTQLSTTVIETPEDGTIEIAPCQPNGPAVPYLFLGSSTVEVPFTATGTWTAPPYIHTITVFLVAGGANGGATGYTSGVAPSGYGNGGSGGTSKGALYGGGGGGGAGQQVTQTVTVTPGQTYTMTVGARHQNTTFGSLATASWQSGTKGGNGQGAYVSGNLTYGGNGGAGANGYGSARLATNGPRGNGEPTRTGAGGSGGVGYGAGGGGGGGNAMRSNITAGGNGAPGYAKITYTVNQYRRGDGTVFEGQP